MSKARTLERVTCTLPAALVKAADAIAAREGRSRSWVVAEALRRFLAGHEGPAHRPPAATAVREDVTPPRYVREAFEAAHRTQVSEELALSPAERVRIADELARDAERIRPQPAVRQLLAFDTWEDYLAWKRTDLLR